MKLRGPIEWIMRTLCVAWLACAIIGVSANGEQIGTGINPALTYYRAFLLAPDLAPVDRDFLYAHEIAGEILPDKFGELMGRYDAQFSLARRATRSTTACDWGLEQSAGPSTLMPHLARAKAVAQTARARAMWALQKGRPTDASDDLVAAFVLGRNVSRDGTAISALVQMAIEAIICNAVAENFWQFTPDALQRLVAGFEAAPARGTVSAAIPTEKTFFRDWAVRKIRELQQQYASNDARVMDGIHELMVPKNPETASLENDLWGRLIKASGGTSDGVLRLLDERERDYQKLAVVLGLPYAEYEKQAKDLSAEFEASSNPFLSAGGPSFLKARTREFRILATVNMVRAAIEYKLHGESALRNVNDPCGNGPFSFQRFIFEGVDRGFELRSALSLDAADSGVLIFVETKGPPFRVSGAQVGKPLSKESAEDVLRRRYGLDRPK